VTDPARSAARGRRLPASGVTRRQALKTAGFAALILGARRAYGLPLTLRPLGRPALPLEGSRPFAKVVDDDASCVVGGLPFREGFLGDPWSAQEMPFHTGQNDFPGGVPPAPDETVDVAIVGGGLSGLTTAFLLRHRRPVLFDVRDRFGGVTQGEIWNDTHYSMGGAYFITPDEGSFLERFYEALGLDQIVRVSYPVDDPVELDDVLRLDFFDGPHSSADRAVFQRYAEAVQYFGDQYPEIPLIEGRDNSWVLDLDRMSYKEDLQRRLGPDIPRELVSAIQGYIFSSFNSSWEEISAASGWNFIAAEEFGRWVCPGGNVWVTDELWRRIAEEYGDQDAYRLRPATRVVDVRQGPGDMMQVSYKLADGTFRSLLARQVVMAGSKHIAKYVLHDLATIDPLRLDAMHQVYAVAYMVANVLLERYVSPDFYDAFLLRDGQLPLVAGDIETSNYITDVIYGHYAEPGKAPASVLTLYWPMPSPEAQFRALVDSAWDFHTALAAPQITRILRLLGLAPTDVRQVRLGRWGHSMPVARVNFIAGGTAERLRTPYLDRVWFVNQDNWALPAFETAVLEAKHFADLIDAALG
jgi:NAD(P)-binding Rossmann-like domain